MPRSRSMETAAVLSARSETVANADQLTQPSPSTIRLPANPVPRVTWGALVAWGECQRSSPDLAPAPVDLNSHLAAWEHRQTLFADDIDGRSNHAFPALLGAKIAGPRSEERRVGKE